MDCLFLVAGTTLGIRKLSNFRPPVVSPWLNDVEFFAVHRGVIRSIDLPGLGMYSKIERFTESESEDPWIGVRPIEKRISRCGRAVFLLYAEQLANGSAQVLRGVIGHIELHVVVADGHV